MNKEVENINRNKIMMPIKNGFLKIIICLLILALSVPCAAAEKFINYQGKVIDEAGQAITGAVTIAFSIWNDPTGIDPALNWIWGESQVVAAKEGIFNVQMGSTVPFAGAVDFKSPDLYLQVNINGRDLLPRTRLTQVPAAFWADEADTLDGLDSSDFAKKTDLVTGGSGVSVNWDNLANVPAGFADGIDNIGARNTLDAADGSPVNAVFVDNLGHVGIGTTTPSDALQVIGDITAKTANLNYLYVGSYMSTGYLDAGNIAVTGTVDGRDIAADGAKLDSLVFGGGSDTTNDAWTGTASLYTTSGNVGIGTANPSALLHLKMSNTGITSGMRFETSLTTTEDWYFYMNSQDDLVFRNDAVDLIVFQKNTGNVGIGTTTPKAKLDVRGSIAVSGTVDGRDIAADGATLDSLVFGEGADTTNDAWTGTTDVYTTAGSVSIGTTNAEGHKLNIISHSQGKAAVRGIDFEKPGILPMLYAEGQLGVYNPAGLPTDPGHVGVLGKKNFWGTQGVGVYAWNADDAGTNIAMYAVADGNPASIGSNYGVYAVAENNTIAGIGANYGIYARAEGGPENYAGYFVGDVETSGNIHASGDITADGTIHSTGNFTADGDIVATYTLVGTQVLVSSATTLAVQGISTYSGSLSTPYGGYFTAEGAKGRGVYGAASASGAVQNYGGYFESAGDQGQGVYGTASGSSGYGGYFSATGDWGTGIYAEGTGVETSYAAVFKGNVQILSKSTDLPVMELGEGLDYAEGFDVSRKGKIAAGSVLVIDPDTPGKLKICSEKYDLKVAGVVAGAKGLGSGVRLGAGRFDHDVALAGRVYCNVEAGDIGIKPGDQLTTSQTPGYAMKAQDHDRSRGAILGKAMEPLAAGESGQILILVTLQ